MTSMGEAVQTELDTYDLSSVLPGDRLEAVSSGSNILIMGPPMTGKDELTLTALQEDPRETPVLLVTSDQSAERLLETYQRLDGDVDREDVYVVDCSGTGGGALEETANVKYVSSPGDLTGIGMGIAKCTNEIGAEAKEGLGFSLFSLSTLLQYASEDRVFNFAHVMTGRIAAAGYLGLWTLDTASPEEQTVATLQGQFDYVIELRETESGQREVRVLGGENEWRTWEPL